jgi:hypothetical protein
VALASGLGRQARGRGRKLVKAVVLQFIHLINHHYLRHTSHHRFISSPPRHLKPQTAMHSPMETLTGINSRG